MGVKKRVKQLIRTADLFSHQVSFRYNDEPAYESLTGGFISIITIVAFIGVFATTFSRTLDKQYIIFDINRFDEETPSYFNTTTNSTFMFATGLTGINMNAGNRYFDIYMQYRHYGAHGRTKEFIPLIPCERDPWDQIGLGSSYDRLGFQEWLCVDPSTNLQLEGKFTSEEFKFYKFAVAQCDPALDTSRPCVTDADIEAYLDDQEAFNFNFYFVNTILNPGEKEYVKTYLEDVNYFPFSRTSGVNANLFISTYTIETDESLYPIQDIKTEQGGIVMNTAQMLNYEVRQDEYLKFYLRKSPISLNVERSFRSIDDTFAYIGGLFASIMFMLGFVGLYDEFSYELEIAKNVYYYEKNDPLDSDQFNFLTYLGYMVFMGFDKIGIELQWPKFQRYHRFLEEVRKQMDMRLIMKKLLYTERLGLAILDTHKYKALHMQEPITLDEADLLRKDHRFYKNFRKKYFPNGEMYEDDESGDSFIRKQEKLNSSELLNFQDSKIYPADETFARQDDGTNAFNADQSVLKKSKKLTPTEIRREEEFHELDKEMKIYILQLKAEAERGDPVAKRIFEKLDARVKDKYLNAQKQRKLNTSFKRILDDSIMEEKQEHSRELRQLEVKRKKKKDARKKEKSDSEE